MGDYGEDRLSSCRSSRHGREVDVGELLADLTGAARVSRSLRAVAAVWATRRWASKRLQGPGFALLRAGRRQPAKSVAMASSSLCRRVKTPDRVMSSARPEDCRLSVYDAGSGTRCRLRWRHALHGRRCSRPYSWCLPGSRPGLLLRHIERCARRARAGHGRSRLTANP